MLEYFKWDDIWYKVFEFMFHEDNIICAAYCWNDGDAMKDDYLNKRVTTAEA